MAGLNHDFLLLSTQESSYTDYMKWINHPKAIQIHDDLMHYMHDTLNWITCYNPAQKMMKHKGLYFYGPTVIKDDGARDAEKVFANWATLFAIGPKRSILGRKIVEGILFRRALWIVEGYQQLQVFFAHG